MRQTKGKCRNTGKEIQIKPRRLDSTKGGNSARQMSHDNSPMAERVKLCCCVIFFAMIFFRFCSLAVSDTADSCTVYSGAPCLWIVSLLSQISQCTPQAPTSNSLHGSAFFYHFRLLAFQMTMELVRHFCFVRAVRTTDAKCLLLCVNRRKSLTVSATPEDYIIQHSCETSSGFSPDVTLCGRLGSKHQLTN